MICTDSVTFYFRIISEPARSKPTPWTEAPCMRVRRRPPGPSVCLQLWRLSRARRERSLSRYIPEGVVRRQPAQHQRRQQAALSAANLCAQRSGCA